MDLYEKKTRITAKIINDLREYGQIDRDQLYFASLKDYGLGRRAVDGILREVVNSGRAVEEEGVVRSR